MTLDPRMARMIGGAFAWPASDDRRGWATFRTTNRHDATVAADNVTHETIPKGMIETMTAGRYGQRLYPYRQTHSTNCNAFMDIQH